MIENYVVLVLENGSWNKVHGDELATKEDVKNYIENKIAMGRSPEDFIIFPPNTSMDTEDFI